MKVLKTFFIFLSFFFLFPLQIFAANYTISGRAIDTLSNLVINAQITVTDLHTKKVVAKTTTGLDGYYVITVAQGAYNITLAPQSQSGLATITANNLVITSNTQHNFTLPIPVPTATDASGKVLNGGTPKAPGAIAPSGANAKTVSNGKRLAQSVANPINLTAFVVVGVVVLLLLVGGGIWYWNYHEKHKSLIYNFKDNKTA